MMQPARTIVYRHACDCDTASRAPRPGADPEHRFDVDGKPFPWLMTEPGPAFRRLDPHTSVYLCAVVIHALDAHTYEPMPITFHTGWPEIGGQPFPWQIFDCRLHLDSDFHARLAVEFVADNVDTDGPIYNHWELQP